MKYVRRNKVAADSAVRFGQALLEAVTECAEAGEPLSDRQRELVAGTLLWAFHEFQEDADRVAIEIPGVREAIPVRVRTTVMERDGFRCLACGATEDLQIDHVMPVALGGTSEIDNLQTLCGSCNRQKRVDPVDYREGAAA